MVNAIAHIDIEAPRLTKQRFVAGGAAAVAMAGGLALAIRLRFHNHAREKLAIGLSFHQQAADQVGSDHLGGAGEEALGNGADVVDGRGGNGGGQGNRCGLLRGKLEGGRTAMMRPFRSTHTPWQGTEPSAQKPAMHSWVYS